MTWINRACVRHPSWTLLANLIVVLLVAPGVLRLRLRTDGAALVPHGDERVAVDRVIRGQFAIEDPVVILIESDAARGIYDREILTLIRDLTADLLKLEGVSSTNVVSLATEKVDRLQENTLRFRSILEPFPRNEAEILAVRDDVRAIELYTGTVVSTDERAAAIYVGVPQQADRIEFCGLVQRLAARHDAGSGRVNVIGAPVAETFLGSHLLADLGIPAGLLEGVPGTSAPVGLLLPALLLIAAVFWVSFRSLRMVALALAEVICCLVIVFGLMGWCGVPVYLTIAVLPVMLTVMGLVDEVHVFACFRRRALAEPAQGRGELVQATMDEMWRPIGMTTMTTALGFLSFAISPIAPVRWFGIFAALGIMLFGLWSLTALPAGLVLFGPSNIAGASGPDHPGSFFERLARHVSRRPWATLSLGLAITLLALFGIRRVEVQDSWVRNFETSSSFYRATERFDSGFFGTHRLLVRWSSPDFELTGSLVAERLGHNRVFVAGDLVHDPAILVGARLELVADGEPRPGASDQSQTAPEMRMSDVITEARVDGERIMLRTTGQGGSPFGLLTLSKRKSVSFEISPDPLRNPRVLARITELERFLRAQDGCAIGGVLGPTDYLSTANFMQRGRAEGSRMVPDDPHEVTRLWHNYDVIRGQDRRLQAVDPTFSRALISVFLKNANFADTKSLLERIRAYEQAELAPDGIELAFAGDVAVSQALIEAIVSTQIRSVGLCLVGIVLLASILGRSLRRGILCVIPSTFAVLVVLAAMGVFGVPLGVATSMFAAMTIGIGVDYAIHLLERLRRNRAAGLDDASALLDALRVTGPAIAVDACAVILGFGVLLFSEVPANAALGGMLVVSMGASLLATLVLLPALLGVRPPGVARR